MTDIHFVLPGLIELVRRLYAESDGLLECQDDAQLWYNRGYGDGMVAAIRELGHGDSLPPDLVIRAGQELAQRIDEQSLMPWGRAHAHGFEMGHKETFELLESA